MQWDSLPFPPWDTGQGRRDMKVKPVNKGVSPPCSDCRVEVKRQCVTWRIQQCDAGQGSRTDERRIASDGKVKKKILPSYCSFLLKKKGESRDRRGRGRRRRYRRRKQSCRQGPGLAGPQDGDRPVSCSSCACSHQHFLLAWTVTGNSRAGPLSYPVNWEQYRPSSLQAVIPEKPFQKQNSTEVLCTASSATQVNCLITLFA